MKQDKENKQLNNVLNECLERLDKGESIEQCLRSYPEYEAELKPLLRTAQAFKKLSTIEPRPEFKARARYQFRAALKETMEPEKRRWSLNWQPRWITAVA